MRKNRTPKLAKTVVALVVLGIFTVVIYYFEGAAASQAATKLVEDARALEQLYQSAINAGVDLESTTKGNYSYFKKIPGLVGKNGNLQAIPSPPENAWAGNVASEWDYAYMFAPPAFLGNLGGTEAGDVAIYLPEVSDDVCKAINEKFSGLGATIIAQGTLPANEKVFCKRYGGDRWNSMVYVLKFN